MLLNYCTLSKNFIVPARRYLIVKMSSNNGESEEINGGLDASNTKKTKQFHDMVHGNISLPRICAHFMNTTQFQRLKDLKQLGVCHHVYPSASNNRFEHCVGTSYLAGEYGKLLRENQPELKISDEDILCLYIAGLCHDIGHGPFSHLWEGFMERMKVGKYEHELMSLKILDALIEDPKNHFVREGLHEDNLGDQDIIFIKEMIYGRPLPGNDQFKGRKPCKHFLYQIVSNGETKIDVDKFDYLYRDCRQLGVSISLDYKRIMYNSRVVGYNKKDGQICNNIDEDTKTMIIYRKKIESSLEDLFRSRYIMHQKVYQHRVTRIIEEMTIDALEAAAPSFQITGKEGIKYNLTTAWKDTVAFNKLSDQSVESRIRHWDEGESQARILFERIIHRRLYKFLGVFEAKGLEDIIRGELTETDPNIRFINCKINYGGKSNPLNKVVMFEKSRPDRLIYKEERDQPEEQKTFIIYCDSQENSENNRDFRSAERLIKAWAEKHKVDISHE